LLRQISKFSFLFAALLLLSASAGYPGFEPVRHKTDSGCDDLLSGRVEEARQKFEKILSDNPVNPDALEGTGLILYYRAVFPESYEKFAALIKSGPEDIRSTIYLRMLGSLSLFYSEQKYADFCREIISGQDFPEPTKDIARLWLLQYYLKTGEPEKAGSVNSELNFIPDWLAIGPFDNEGKAGFGTEYPPEKEIKYDASYSGKEREVRWRDLPVKTNDGAIDLAAMLRPTDNCVAYALTHVWMPKQTRVIFRAGSDDGIKVWVNGQPLLQSDVYRPFQYDQNSFGAVLAYGWNRVMVKVTNGIGGWRFSIRITDTEGKKIENIHFRTRLPENEPVCHETESFKTENLPDFLSEEASRKDLSPAESSMDNFYLGLYHRFCLDADASEHADFKCFEKCTAAFPDCPVFQTEYGVSADDQNVRRTAYEKSLATDPESTGVRVKLVDYYIGLQRFGQARQLLEEIDRHIRGNFLVEYNRARVFAMRNFDELAMETYRKSLELNPEFMESRQAMTGYLDQNSTSEKASAEYQKLFDRDRENYTGNLANAAVKRGEYSRAEKLWSDLKILRPFSTEPYRRTAMIYKAQKKYSEAVKELEAGLAIAPEDHYLLGELGLCLRYAGQEEEAMNIWNRAIKIKPNYTWLRDYMDFLSREKAGYDEPYESDAENIIAAGKTLQEIPDASYCILLDQKIVKVNPDGTSSYTVHMITKILQDTGVEGNSYNEIDFLPGQDRVEILKARVIRADGSVLESSEIGERPAFSDGSVYSDYHYKTVSLGGVGKGTIVELKYRVDTFGKNIFADYFGDIFVMQDRVPVKQSKYVVILPAGKNLYYTKNKLGTEPEVKTDKNETVYIWSGRDIPGIKSESNMPPYLELAANVRVSTFKKWDEVVNWYYGLIRNQFIPGEEIRKKTVRLTAGLKTDAEKIRAIYNFVVTDIRYLGIEFGIGGYQPDTAISVFQKQYGDCKGKAVLLKTMLKEAGIESDIVLVRTANAGNISTEPAGMHFFNHAICAVPAAGKTLFLDGTAQYTGMDEFPSLDQETAALLIGDREHWSFTRTPGLPPEHNVSQQTGTVSILPDSSEVLVNDKLTGFFAAYARFKYHIPEKRLEQLNREWGQRFAGASVLDAKFSDLNDIDKPAEIFKKAKIPQFLRSEDNKFKFRPALEPLDMIKNYASLGDREHDMRFYYNYRLNQKMEFIIPENMKFGSIPENTVLNTPFGSFSVSFEKKDRKTLVMEKTFVFGLKRVSRQDYQNFKKFCAEIDRVESMEISLEKTE